MKKVFDFFGGRKNFDFLLVSILGLVLVFYDKLAGEFYFGSIIAGLGVAAHYNVQDKQFTDEKIQRGDADSVDPTVP